MVRAFVGIGEKLVADFFLSAFGPSVVVQAPSEAVNIDIGVSPLCLIYTVYQSASLEAGRCTRPNSPSYQLANNYL